MEILHIRVKKEYFEQVEQGLKEEEYREIKPYWKKRLLGRYYDKIYYYLGYTKKKIVFNFYGYTIKTILHKEFGEFPKVVYAIKLHNRKQK